MPCYHPINAWKPPPGYQLPGGKGVTFNDPCDARFLPIQLPCGQCVGCRLERSKDWALRCIHEAQFHEENCFLTLTYEEDRFSLCVEDIQLFLKRLRKHVEPLKIRFFQCGEYGSLNFRPHHHVLVFGYNFPDRKVWGRSVAGFIYRSDILERLWPFGFSTIGDVSFDSAAYVARYIMKKQTGRNAEEYYQGRKPEFITMSRRPGIGQQWFATYGVDLYQRDFITYNQGLRAKPPRYYDNLFGANHKEELNGIKEKRLLAVQRPDVQVELTPERLAAREEVVKSKLSLTERSL